MALHTSLKVGIVALYIFKKFSDVAVLEYFLPEEHLVLILEDKVAMRHFLIDRLNKEEPELL